MMLGKAAFQVNDLIMRLQPRERRGSKPRCHWLTHGPADQVAARLTGLVEPWATISAVDHWMPFGFEQPREAQLHQETSLLGISISRDLGDWWLPPNRRYSRTPNFDIASTCSIGGIRGLLLIEAKAHDEELNNEKLGRRLKANATDDRKASHETILTAIQEARKGLSKATSLPWNISRDTHYQMSNRFAWSWKLATLGIPVVMVYLGLLQANEMADRGRPLVSHDEWDALVKSHSQAIFPDGVWDKRWSIRGTSLVPLIRSVRQPLEGPIKPKPARKVL